VTLGNSIELKATVHDELFWHDWLDVPERNEYKLGVMCTGVCMDRHLATSRTATSSQPLMLLLVYDLSTGTVSLCLVVDSARTAVGRAI